MVLPSLPRLRFESRRLTLLRSALTAPVGALIASSTAGSSEVAWRKLGLGSRRTLEEREDETTLGTRFSLLFGLEKRLITHSERVERI